MSDDANPCRTPAPPYYAVIFSSQRAPGDAGYNDMAEAMDALAAKQDGYLGHESARGGDGFGITVSYWRDEEAVKRWKAVAAHRAAQLVGATLWYERYDVRVARVERAYANSAARTDALAASVAKE